MDGDNDVLMGEPEVVQNQRKAATGIGVTGDDFSADEVTGSADASVPVGVADQRSCRPGNDDRGSGFEPISDRMEDERERFETVPSASWKSTATVNGGPGSACRMVSTFAFDARGSCNHAVKTLWKPLSRCF